jgi:hypothetical protein
MTVTPRRSLALLLVPVLLAPAAPAAAHGRPRPTACPVSYSDALDQVGGIGGLSDLAWDNRSHAWASTVDNHGTDPARIWFFRRAADPVIVGDPLVLRRPDGTAYDGTTSDNEGLAVLPGGDFLVSSEVEPSIRVYGRDGVQKSQLPVPSRFAVAPAGEATANATLEGLTLADGGRRIIAAMEGALSGDSDPAVHRFLIYDRTGRGGYALARQVIYRTQPGQRISEVAAYDRDSLVVMEASFNPATGNTIQLYAVKNVTKGRDVSAVADAGPLPSLRKSLVADLVPCPSLGATARQPQANPLLDNFEGMAIVPGRRADTIRLISDDNFNPAQITRILTIPARLP